MPIDPKVWIQCLADCICHKCGGPTEYRIVEDSEGHEDVNHRCKDEKCMATRWVDGSDA
jgi:hypothetical protein